MAIDRLSSLVPKCISQMIYKKNPVKIIVYNFSPFPTGSFRIVEWDSF